MPWAGLPPTRSDCPCPHLTWSWTSPGAKHPQLVLQPWTAVWKQTENRGTRTMIHCITSHFTQGRSLHLGDSLSLLLSPLNSLLKEVDWVRACQGFAPLLLPSPTSLAISWHFIEKATQCLNSLLIKSGRGKKKINPYSEVYVYIPLCISTGNTINLREQ